MYMENNYFNMDYDNFFKIIDNLYDEIWVYDSNYTVVYVNKACRRHYGLEPSQIIGKNFFDMVDENWWSPSILPFVYADKKTYAIKQTTNIGLELINIATPILDDNGNILFVSMSVRDSISGSNLFNPIQLSNYLEDINANDNILFFSKEMADVLKLAKKISKVDSTCLITGESGTGKSLIAKNMHKISNRSKFPFVTVNCPSIPNDLIESELFGYKKGAFTGAHTEGHKGLFESANGGTLLLDEISEIPINVQAKLLHVIQEKEFTPIGSSKPMKVDIKIIAATNKDIFQLSQAGSFREDLYYRLNIFELYMPPLRERTGDIEKLIFYYLNFYGDKYEIRHEISPAALKILINYSWPGNVRELIHVIERLVVTVDDIVIEKNHLPKSIFQFSIQNNVKTDNISTLSFDEAMSMYEKKLVTDAYKKYNSSRKVSTALSISQTKASNLIRKYINPST